MARSLKKHKTVRQALLYVEQHPDWPEDHKRLDMPIWEFVARNLYDHANGGDDRIVGSVGRATRAMRIIMDRVTGTRRTGTAPASRADRSINFRDLSKVDELPVAPPRPNM